ncbi:MAG: hypothetical protein R2755_13510 [Acidimicrobiales bacterium]
MRAGFLQEGGLRQAVLMVAAVAAIGTMAELALIGHWHGPAQLAPWLAAQASLSAAWLAAGATSAGGWRSRLRVRTAQVLAVGQLLACGWGVAVHLQANWGFAAELNRAAGVATVAAAAMRGRIPLLAPAFGALPALLVLVATAVPAATGTPAAPAVPVAPDGRRQVWPPLERRGAAAVRSGLWRLPRDPATADEDGSSPR